MRRVAILGFGASGQRFLSLVQRGARESDVFVYSSRGGDAPGVTVSSRLEELENFQPEIAVICGPAADRVRAAKALPDTMQGIFVEKPLAHSLVEAEKVAHLLAPRAAVCQVGYNLRFSSSLRHFRHLVQSDLLGDVLSVRAETGQYLPDWRPGRDYRTTVSAQKKTGGGVLRELSHEIDYLQWIFGDFRWVSAWTGSQSSLDVDVEDTAHLTCGFGERARAGGLVAQVNLDFVRRDRTRTITAVCSEGTLRWDGIAQKVEKRSPTDSSWQSLFAEGSGGSSTYELQWDSFEASMAGQSEPLVTVADGLSVLAAIDAIERSAMKGGETMMVERSISRR